MVSTAQYICKGMGPRWTTWLKNSTENILKNYFLYYNMNFNLLDLNNDVLNIIGYYVKKDNLERKTIKDRQIRNDQQIIN